MYLENFVSLPILYSGISRRRYFGLFKLKMLTSRRWGSMRFQRLPILENCNTVLSVDCWSTTVGRLIFSVSQVTTSGRSTFATSLWRNGNASCQLMCVISSVMSGIFAGICMMKKYLVAIGRSKRANQSSIRYGTRTSRGRVVTRSARATAGFYRVTDKWGYSGTLWFWSVVCHPA